MTTPAQTISQDLANFVLAQQRDGKAAETIRPRLQVLKQMSKLIDLNNPEQVKDFIATSTWATKTRIKVVDTYSAYARFKQITWNPPHSQ